MIRRESVAFASIHGQHADHAVQPFERHSESRRRVVNFRGIATYPASACGIAIDDRLAFFRHPAAQSFADANVQRREQAEVVAAHQFGQQPAVRSEEHGHRIVRNHLAQTHGKHGKRFAQAERVAQILAEFEHGLRFLARRRDGGEEVRFRSTACVVGSVLLESGGWRQSALHLNRLLESAVRHNRFFGRSAPCAPVRGSGASRTSTICGSKAGPDIEPPSPWPRPAARRCGIDDARPARPGNRPRPERARRSESARLSVRRDSRLRPSARGASARSARPDRETRRAPEFPRPPRCGSSSFRILPESGARAC